MSNFVFFCFMYFKACVEIMVKKNKTPTQGRSFIRLKIQWVENKSNKKKTNKLKNQISARQ